VTEIAASLDSSADLALRRRGPRPADEDDVRLAEFRARVRTLGESWTDSRPGELIDALVEAAAGDPALTGLVRAGGVLLEDFLTGYRRKAEAETVSTTSRDLAGDLIAGRRISQDTFDGLADEYLIAIVRAPETDDRGLVLQDAVGPGALITHGEFGIVVLVPDVDQERTPWITTQLTRCLGDRGRLAITGRPKTEIADGYREAVEIMRLVVAGRRPSGVYSIHDVLVELAVTRNEWVTDNLISVIKPLRLHPVLWETLMALIDADYIRNKAARSLFIHRSTLDYRLQRIADVTGCDATTHSGARLLTAAVIADAVAN
jgi:PucR-like helix-turn-helix protein